MAGFVGCLDVNIDEVFMLEGFERVLRLSQIVRIIVAGDSGYVDNVKAGQSPDAVDEVNGRDDRSGYAELLFK